MTATPDPKAHQLLGGLAQQAQYVHEFAKAGRPTEALEHAGAVERLIAAWRLAAGHADREAIHLHFGLSDANYLVVPRTLLQSMPDECQVRFVALLDEMDDAFQHVPQAEAYEVKSGKWMQLDDMTDSELYTAGITVDGDDEDGPGESTRYHRREDGAEMTGQEYAFSRRSDPVPHYNRGRARVEPCLGDREAASA